MMQQREIVAIVGLFITLVIGMFVFAYLKRTETDALPTVQVPDIPGVIEESPYAYIKRIDAKHFYIDGVHTLVGEILMPTPCDLLDPQNTIAESFPEQVFIDFNVINNAEVCAQVVTPQRFKVSFSVSENVTFSAKLDGRLVDLNLIPAAEGESPDDFELFIKG